MWVLTSSKEVSQTTNLRAMEGSLDLLLQVDRNQQPVLHNKGGS